MFPAADKRRLFERISNTFIDRLVAEVTRGFKGDVGVVPRQFLRAFVDHLDLVDQNEDYDPMQQPGFEPSELKPEEKLTLSGESRTQSDSADQLVPVEDLW
jgi:P-loop Domain of unknown function (DUF2791)